MFLKPSAHRTPYLYVFFAVFALTALVFASQNVAIAGATATALNSTNAAKVQSVQIGAPTAYPPKEFGGSLAYDAKSGYIVSIDSGSTWRFANDTWQQFQVPSHPNNPNFACFVYDPANGNVILFGGATYAGAFGGIGFATYLSGSTWSFTSNSGWQNVTTSAGNPLTVKYPACAYDPSIDGGAIIMFGGATSSYNLSKSLWLLNTTNETWAYANVSGSFKWVQLHPLVSPSSRFGGSMVYDNETNELIMYGGAQNGTSTANGGCTLTTCPHLHDTWLFSGNLTSSTWVELNNGVNTSQVPVGSIFTGMAYDPLNGGALIDYGGQINGYKSFNSTSNATWEFNTTTNRWVNITSTAGEPPTRFSPLFAFDPKTGSVVMFSGLGGTVNQPERDDMWEFSKGVWHLASPIIFKESGLTSNTEWNITVSGATQEAVGKSTNAVFDLVNGSYKYNVPLVPGYNAIKNKTFSVSGPNTITIKFKKA